jgi:hypothetical protein
MDSKRGRPPKPEGERAEEVFQLRLTMAEKAAWKTAAERADMTLSAWIRDRLGKSARRESR